MACFAAINVSQGSVATYARCGRIFDIHLTANLTKKKILNRFRIDRVLVSVVSGPVFWPALYLLCRRTHAHSLHYFPLLVAIGLCQNLKAVSINVNINTNVM